jgi:hypothetical protein
MRSAILAELNRRPNTIWNPTRVDPKLYQDSMSMAYARQAMEQVDDDDWRRKYELYFGGRKRIRRELGTTDDPIARMAYYLRFRDDSILAATNVGKGSFVAGRLPSDRPLGTVNRLKVYYDLHNGDVWRQTYRGKPGHRVYRLDFYPHLLLEDMRGGWFPGECVQDFP